MFTHVARVLARMRPIMISQLFCANPRPPRDHYTLHSRSITCLPFRYRGARARALVRDLCCIHMLPYMCVCVCICNECTNTHTHMCMLDCLFAGSLARSLARFAIYRFGNRFTPTAVVDAVFVCACACVRSRACSIYTYIYLCIVSLDVLAGN